MPLEGLVIVPVPGLGVAVQLIEYAACLASGGDLFSCSPIGQLVGLFESLFAGVPTELKTEEAQMRLAQSKLPQIQALAANLEIWVRNGVPLSTGDPVLRAQLQGWIHGTIYDSGLGLRVTPQGYNQFAALDTTLWRVLASEYHQSGIAIDTLVDNFRGVNRLLDRQPAGQPPPPAHQPAGGGQDFGTALMQFCAQCLGPELFAPLAAALKLGTVQPPPLGGGGAGAGGGELGRPESLPPPEPGPSIPASLQTIADSITTIVTLLKSGDLAGLPAALVKLYECVCPDLDAIVKALQEANVLADVPQPIIDRLVAVGAVDAQLGQLAGGGPVSHVLSALLGSLFSGGEEVAGEAIGALGHFFLAVLKPLGAKLFTLLDAEWNTVVNAIGPTVSRVWPEAERLLTTLTGDLATIESTLPKVLFDFAASAIGTPNDITPETVEAVGFKALGVAFIIGQGVHLLAAIAGYLGYPMSSVWGHNAQLLIQMLSFETITEALHGSFFPAAIGQHAKYKYQSDFRSLLPNLGAADQMFARRKISESEWATLVKYNGLNEKYEAPQQQLSYRPLSPFILARLFANRDYPYATMQHQLEDMAIRPDFITTLNDGLEELSTANLENTYIAQLEQAFAKGIVDQATLTSEMNELKWGKKAQSIVLKRAALVRSVALVDSAVKEYAPEVVAGYASPVQMADGLRAAGAQQWYVDLQVGLAQSKAALRETLKAQGVAHQDATRIFGLLTRAAVDSYVKAEINREELTAALALARVKYIEDLGAAGVGAKALAPETAISGAWIAAAVADADTRSHFARQFVYGLTLTRDAATQLKAQVAALLKQFADTLIDVTQLRQQLSDLGVPDNYVQALVARAAATSIAHHKGTSFQQI